MRSRLERLEARSERLAAAYAFTVAEGQDGSVWRSALEANVSRTARLREKKANRALDKVRVPR